jgi:hypothetical protein
MTQSIWQTELGKKFKRVEADLEQNWRNLSKNDLEKAIKNLEKGFEQLNFLAISANFPQIQRKKYDFDYIQWQQKGEQTKKGDQKIVFLDVRGEKIGLCEGESFFSEEIPIFNHLDFLETFEDGNHEHNFDELIRVVKEFKALPVCG